VKLLILKLILGLLLPLFLVRPSFAQETYYFNEEFSVDRPGNQLDNSKWVIYPNNQTCNNETITEVAGFALFRQCKESLQFPYVVSKSNPFPNSDFSTSIKFEYFKAAPWGNGIELVDKAPENGAGFTQLFGIGFWEDTSSGLNMRFQYKGDVVYSTAINRNPHVFKLNKEGSIYKMFLDDQLLFTSPSTTEKVEAIYLGNPSLQAPPLADWSWFRVDYIRVTQTGPTEIIPQPFLDLPWDYESNGMSFNEAATSINASFDHEYPLLSTNLNEPEQAQGSLIDLAGGPRSVLKPYSSHDGYDYGYRAQTKLNTPQLAAADGEATFMNSCAPCGNAILIDHKNGFQTRYYHLQPDGLITSVPGQKVDVTKGQQIGKVGYTGNVNPKGESGAHIHFMVIQDKNKDGNFEDNIPDGLVDPFGWQSLTPDPWENYTFNYLGQPRTGNKSYYLFTKKLDNLNANLTANQAVFNIGKTRLEFPQGSTDQNLNLIVASEPSYFDSILNALGSILRIEAKDPSGNFVTSFLNNFLLTINFNQFDLSRYNTNTLSIYSSQDGTNWIKETTQIDLTNKTASTALNHLTYFALMAERKDSLAPTTTPILEGQKGTANNFRSDVRVNLNASDNENGMGVEFTAYGFNGQEWQSYTEPLIFSNEGFYKIYFYSQDKDGNSEEIKSVEFSIDKTPPEANIEVDQSLWDLKITPTATDSALTKKAGKKLNEFTYTLKDLSGNTLIMEAFELNSKYIDIFKLYSLKYNSDPKITLPDNLFDTNYIFLTPKNKQSLIPGENKPETKIVNQNFAIKNGPAYIIVADILKNKTQINIIENKQVTKTESPGLTLLNLQTKKANLSTIINKDF
jgi:murein DD-endopeptidase MepM/ murein hydrolase activator NlpD/orotate phosphoribosyltransferase-like protein